MTTLADKIEALAKDATPGSLVAMGWGNGSTPDGMTNIFNEDAEVLLMECIPVVDANLIVELVNNLPTILRALRERDQAAEALRPFAEYGKWAVDENGWNLGSPRERLCDWFGPSDFHRAATTLASIEGAGHE